jgi:hypothetical protein
MPAIKATTNARIVLYVAYQKRGVTTIRRGTPLGHVERTVD